MAVANAGTIQVLGVPVRLDPSLAVILFLFAASAHTSTIALIAFVVGGAAAVLAHELGHALAARALGASGIRISLHGFGGLTQFQMSSPSRWRASLIAVAGPAVGLALGLAVWLARAATAPSSQSSAAEVYSQLLFVTAGWSVINLLPVLPLDGGRLLEQILPGSPQNRSRLAGVVSVVLAGGAALWFWQRGAQYPALMFALLGAYGFVGAVRTTTAGSPPQPSASGEVFRLAASGDYPAAAAVAREATSIHPALAALLPAILVHDSEAAQRLWRLYERKPDDAMTRACVALWRTHSHDWPGILTMLSEGPLLLGAGTAALHGAYEAGAFADGAEIGEAVLRTTPNAWIAYNTACCWSLSGNDDRALSALRRAVDYGWTDWRQVDADTDLAAVRRSPAFTTWRTTIAAAQA